MSTQERWTSREGLRFSHRLVPHPSPRFPPTLFVSGAFQTMDSWGRFARAYAPHTTVLLVDPPGMGRSDLLPEAFGIDYLAACLEQVLDEHGVERANLVAASYGTPSAYRLAQLRPDRVERLVLAGTMKEMPAHMRAPVAATVATALRGDREALADEVAAGLMCLDPARDVVRRDRALRVLTSGILRMSDEELLKYAANTRRLLEHAPLEIGHRIRGPEALVFTGEHDVFTTPAGCREIAEGFARGWFTTVRGADHLFHIECFDVVVALLLGFMLDTLSDAPPAGCTPLLRIDADAPPARPTPGAFADTGGRLSPGPG